MPPEATSIRALPLAEIAVTFVLVTRPVPSIRSVRASRERALPVPERSSVPPGAMRVTPVPDCVPPVQR